MKIWQSVLCVSVFGSLGALAGDPVVYRQSAPVNPEPLPCNGFPEYYSIPVNQFLWLGAHGAGSSTQDETIETILNDGIRFLNFPLCPGENGRLYACDAPTQTAKPGAVEWRELADQVFDYVRTIPEQVIVVQLSTATVDGSFIKATEDALEQVCKLHSERTEGTDDYVNGECPFIYKHNGRGWPSLGELVNYDPEMAQWEGDGELVGVRSRIILTYTEFSGNTPELLSSYFSKPFWTPTLTQATSEKEKQALESQLRQLCKSGTAIGIQGYPAQNNHGKQSFDARFWDEALLSTSICNLNQSPRETRINLLMVDFYKDQLQYLTEFLTEIVPINFAKWQNAVPPAKRPSTLIVRETKHSERERDEL